MKRYVKADGIKTDIFKKATSQAAINDLYLGLMKISRALENMSEEDYNKLGLSGFYQEVNDKLQDIYPYYKG